ncbi:hypothetical protein AMTR_s00033p00101640 [Amborella trichopoda]|uniref:Uncharacterized protein n=1 Tax=Amborella trichopoda TaxID=13333 RepID=U5CYI7_AMBTC|nr:hypothetical protein AMTR_s00033p00101640 [Amborella trichopoda]
MGIKALIVLFLVFCFCFDLTKAIPNTPLQIQHDKNHVKVEAHFGSKVLALEVATEFGHKYEGERRILQGIAGLKPVASIGKGGTKYASRHSAGSSRHGSFKWAFFGVLSMWVFLV